MSPSVGPAHKQRGSRDDMLSQSRSAPDLTGGRTHFPDGGRTHLSHTKTISIIQDAMICVKSLRMPTTSPGCTDPHPSPRPPGPASSSVLEFAQLRHGGLAPRPARALGSQPGPPPPPTPPPHPLPPIPPT